MTIEDWFPEPESQPITAKEAILGVESKTFNRALATVATAIWNSVKPGQNGTHYRPGYYMNSLKVDPDRPMPTIPKIIPGGGGHMHWQEQRSLSIEEAKRGASFPDLYRLTGKFDVQWERIGNSVPPLFMRSIARNVKSMLETGFPIRNDGKLRKVIDYPALLEEAYQQMIAPRADDAPTVISTFAGGGGSSAGYHMAGFRELLAVEWDDNAVETLRLNFPHLDIYHGDIAKLSVDEVLQRTGLQPGELDVLDGSPPCQGLSTAGKRDFYDDRNQLFREYVRLLRGLQPKVFVMENVSGMVKGKMKLIFAEILRELKTSGYKVSARLLNAMYFNVPQSRERMIFIGVRDDLGIEPSHPKAESQPIASRVINGANNNGLNGEFLRLEGKTSDLIRVLNQGQRMEQLYEQIHGKGKKAYFAFSRLHQDKPTKTIAKDSAGLIHWAENRTLTIGEYKRVASFPDNFSFIGSFSSALQRIGNSVPPLFMRSIAANVRENILP